MKKIVYITVFIVSIFVSNFSYSEQPNINAQSAILIDAQSGRVLFEYDPHIRLPMASTTKIMTALIALENGKLDNKIKIEKESVGIEGSSIYLREGEILTLEDLLYGLMLRSGNDASIAIANYIGGGLNNFVNLMNSKAMEIGAKNTKFKNPHGLHDDNHYSTAYDLSLITRSAMNIQNFKTITSSKHWKCTRDKNNLFYNKNKTLWEYEGGNGVKTGYTQRAGRCLVSSASRHGLELITVVLNDRDWFNDSYKLMDYGFENYNTYVIFDEHQYISSIDVNGGEEPHVDVVTSKPFLYPLREDELDKIKMDISLPNLIGLPIKKEDPIGEITVFLDGRIIGRENLVAREGVNKLGYINKIIRKLSGDRAVK